MNGPFGILLFVPDYRQRPFLLNLWRFRFEMNTGPIDNKMIYNFNHIIN